MLLKWPTWIDWNHFAQQIRLMDPSADWQLWVIGVSRKIGTICYRYPTRFVLCKILCNSHRMAKKIEWPLNLKISWCVSLGFKLCEWFMKSMPFSKWFQAKCLHSSQYRAFIPRLNGKEAWVMHKTHLRSFGKINELVTQKNMHKPQCGRRRWLNDHLHANLVKH